MAFSVLEKPTTRTQGQYNGKEGQDDSIREWGIISESGPETADRARAFAASIARFGDPHPFNPAKICVEVDCQQISPIAFDFIATYRVPVGAGGKPKDPLQQIAKVSYRHAVAEEQIDRDADGKAIQMATGESFDPPIRRPFGDLVVTVERNVSTYDALAMDDILFCTNADTWLGLPPGRALLTSADADQTINADGSSYWTKTTTVQFRKPRFGIDPAKVWYWRQLAAGYLWKLSPTMQTAFLGHAATRDIVVDAFTSDGQKPPRPLNHDPATGYPFPLSLVAGLAAVDYSPTRAKFYEFKIYESKPFSNAQIF